MNRALNLPLGSEASINLSSLTNTQLNPRTCVMHANTRIIQKTGMQTEPQTSELI